jgi:hypothetical protein
MNEATVPAVPQQIYELELERNELSRRHEDVMVSLDLFELGERIKGNPAALADLPLSEWGPLPPGIEALYDLQWELAEKIYILNDVIYETTKEKHDDET